MDCLHPALFHYQLEKWKAGELRDEFNSLEEWRVWINRVYAQVSLTEPDAVAKTYAFRHSASAREEVSFGVTEVGKKTGGLATTGGAKFSGCYICAGDHLCKDCLWNKAGSTIQENRERFKRSQKKTEQSKKSEKTPTAIVNVASIIKKNHTTAHSSAKEKKGAVGAQTTSTDSSHHSESGNGAFSFVSTEEIILPEDLPELIDVPTADLNVPTTVVESHYSSESKGLINMVLDTATECGLVTAAQDQRRGRHGLQCQGELHFRGCSNCPHPTSHGLARVIPPRQSVVQPSRGGGRSGPVEGQSGYKQGRYRVAIRD
jgi:hypothetical protein